MQRIFPLSIIILLICGCVWAAEKSTDHTASVRQLAEKADSGDAKALYDLAYLHDIGYDTIPVDSIRSTALYLLSAKKGYAPAQNFIGFRYYKGEIVNQNLDSAIFWIREAAKAGDITAAANLGYLLIDSPDVPHDSVEGAVWLMKAAEEGVKEPQIKISEMKNNEWIRLPSDSALKTGIRYYTGKSPIMGFHLLEIASQDSLPQAWALLGDAYSKGRGVPYDHEKSIKYFLQAAEAGNPSAQYVIAELLDIFPDALAGTVRIEENLETGPASYWYEKAAEAGINSADDAYNKLYTFP